MLGVTTRDTLYDHLSESAFRLVTLAPGKFLENIQCRLSTHERQDHPAYEALSYVWGDPSSRREINLDGNRISVTENLESALRHLRHLVEPRMLWIDALAINQEDVEERNTQVKHMGSIYKQAWQVVIWLGPEDEDSDLAFDAFAMLPRSDEDPPRHWDTEMHPELEGVIGLTKYSTAVGHLHERAWWSRVWTVQESALGSTLLFVCGLRNLSSDLLFAVAESYRKHAGSCCPDIMRTGLYSQSLQLTMQALSRLKHARNSPDMTSLESQIARHRGRRCFLAHDKIYGVLGMARKADADLVTLEYSKPVSLVYEDLAFNILSHSQTLKFFSHIFGRAEANAITLPSWVPDWTAEGDQNEFDLLQMRGFIEAKYKAAGTSRALPTRAENRLFMNGLILDTVAFVGDSMGNPDDREEYHEILGSWREAITLDKLYSHRFQSGGDTTYHDIYCQTLCGSLVRAEAGGDSLLRVTNTPEQQLQYQAWEADLLSRNDNKIDHDADMTRTVRSFDTVVQIIVKMRRLLLSRDEGLLGVAHEDARVGDKIALLEGGKTPYILRPIAETGNEYELVGDCYVHGKTFHFGT